jgi:hypothetical protein
MSNAALSVFTFGIYLVVAGFGFLVMPNTVLGLLGVPSTDEPYLRIAGILMILIGITISKQAEMISENSFCGLYMSELLSSLCCYFSTS